MAVFASELLLHPLDHRKWEVMAPFVVETETIGFVIVPAGFIFDGNSIPRFLWWESTPTDWMEAGCVHDYLYRTGCVTRDKADATYREILGSMKMGKVRRGARYWALRAFGWHAFKKDKPVTPVDVPQ